MVKSFFKELAIILLLILAIMVLLAVLFYDYMPNSKTVPAKVEAYKLSEDVKAELEKDMENAKTDEIVKTYQLDAIDIEHYERTKEYNKGKVNPFAQYSTGTASGSTTNSGTTSGNGTSSNNNNTNNNNNDNNNSGTFLNVVGK